MTWKKCNNNALIKENLRRFWWVSALYFVCLFFAVPFRLLVRAPELKEELQFAKTQAASLGGELTDYFNPDFFNFTGGAEALAFFVVPVFIAGLLFSYMNKRKNIDTIHALPIKRSKLFTLNITSGALLYTIPLIAVCIIVAIIITATGFWPYITFAEMIIWLINSLLYLTIIFAIACFFSICSGNVLVMAILTYVFSAFPMIVFAVVNGTLSMWFYGYVTPTNDSIWITISPAAYIVQNVDAGVLPSASPLSGILYLVFALAMLAVSCLLYTYRRSESTSSTIAFKPAKPIIKYIFTFLCAIIAGVILYYVTNSSSIVILVLGYLVGGAIGYMVLHAIIQKDIRAIKTGAKGLALCLVIIFAVSMMLCFDIFGYQKRVPEASEVTKIYFDPIHYNNSGEIYETGYTSPENIERIIKLHQACIDAKFNENYSYVTDRTDFPEPGLYASSQYYRNYFYTTYTDINYDLGGRELIRNYMLPFEAYNDILPEILATEEGKRNTFAILNEKLFVYPKKLTVIDAYRNEYIINRPEQVKMLIDAMKKDILADDNPIELELTKPSYGWLNFESKLAKSTSETSADSSGSILSSDAKVIDLTPTEYRIKPYYSNTIAAAKECGINIVPIDKSNISAVYINLNNFDRQMFESAQDYDAFIEKYENPYSSGRLEISDPEQISKLYDSFTEMSPLGGIGYIDYCFDATALVSTPSGFVTLYYTLDPYTTPDFVYESFGMKVPVR